MAARLSSKVFGVVVVILIAGYVDSLKLIMIASGITKSHYLFNNRISCALKERGHNITMITPVWFHYIGENKSPCNIKNIHLYSGPPDPEFHSNYSRILTNWGFDTKRITKDTTKLLYYWNATVIHSCRYLLDQNDIMDSLFNDEYDAALVNVYAFCPLGIATILKLPIIWLNAGNYIGPELSIPLQLPFPFSYVPLPISSFSDKMTLGGRFANLLFNLHSYWFYTSSRSNFWDFEADLFRVSPAEQPMNWRKTSSRVKRCLINGDEMVDFPRPVQNSVHYLGQLGGKDIKKDEKLLPKEWMDILSSAKDGLILFSFGSVTDTNYMPDDMKNAFFQAFKSFPRYTVVWKVTKPFDVPHEVTNVRLVKWIPQRQILGHPNLKVFITHGGYNSFLETCQHAVPAIMIPLFLDQYGNAKRAERLGISITIDKKDLTADTLAKAIASLLADSSYKNRAVKISSMMDDTIRPREDLLAHHVEHVHRHFKHIETPQAANRLNLLQYYCLDVITALLSVVLLLVGLVRRILRCGANNTLKLWRLISEQTI